MRVGAAAARKNPKFLRDEQQSHCRSPLPDSDKPPWPPAKVLAVPQQFQDLVILRSITSVSVKCPYNIGGAKSPRKQGNVTGGLYVQLSATNESVDEKRT